MSRQYDSPVLFGAKRGNVPDLVDFSGGAKRVISRAKGGFKKTDRERESEGARARGRALLAFSVEVGSDGSDTMGEFVVGSVSISVPEGTGIRTHKDGLTLDFRNFTGSLAVRKLVVQEFEGKASEVVGIVRKKR